MTGGMRALLKSSAASIFWVAAELPKVERFLIGEFHNSGGGDVKKPAWKTERIWDLWQSQNIFWYDECEHTLVQRRDSRNKRRICRCSRSLFYGALRGLTEPHVSECSVWVQLKRSLRLHHCVFIEQKWRDKTHYMISTLISQPFSQPVNALRGADIFKHVWFSRKWIV